MDCPASVEIITNDSDGRLLSVETEPCIGTLGPPVENDATGQTERLISVDEEGVRHIGKDHVCDTCGQTTLVQTRTE